MHSYASNTRFFQLSMIHVLRPSRSMSRAPSPNSSARRDAKSYWALSKHSFDKDDATSLDQQPNTLKTLLSLMGCKKVSDFQAFKSPKWVQPEIDLTTTVHPTGRCSKVLVIEPSGHLRHWQGELVLLHVDVKNRHLHRCQNSVCQTTGKPTWFWWNMKYTWYHRITPAACTTNKT